MVLCDYRLTLLGGFIFMKSVPLLTLLGGYSFKKSVPLLTLFGGFGYLCVSRDVIGSFTIIGTLRQPPANKNFTTTITWIKLNKQTDKNSDCILQSHRNNEALNFDQSLIVRKAFDRVSLIV